MPQLDADGNPIVDPNDTPVGEPNGDTEPEGNEPTGDTEPETPEEEPGDTEADTPEERELALLREHGLDGTYHNLPDALKSLKHGQAATTQAQQEAAEMRRLLLEVVSNQQRGQVPQQQTPGIDENALHEKFVDDPFEAMRDAGFVKKDDLNDTQAELASLKRQYALVNFVNTLRDLGDDFGGVAEHIRRNANNPQTLFPPKGANETWDAMLDYYQQHPELHNLPDATVWPMLHGYVTSKRPAAASTPATDKPKNTPAITTVSADKKAKAATHAGKQPANVPKEPDYSNMTSQQIKDDLKKRGLVRS